VRTCAHATGSKGRPRGFGPLLAWLRAGARPFDWIETILEMLVAATLGQLLYVRAVGARPAALVDPAALPSRRLPAGARGVHRSRRRRRPASMPKNARRTAVEVSTSCSITLRCAPPARSRGRCWQRRNVAQGHPRGEPKHGRYAMTSTASLRKCIEQLSLKTWGARGRSVPVMVRPTCCSEVGGAQRIGANAGWTQFRVVRPTRYHGGIPRAHRVARRRIKDR
jgi:hypothetical protein